MKKEIWWKIQDWKRNLKYSWENVVVTVQGGYKCSCGRVQKFKSPIIEGDVGGKRMLIENGWGHKFGIGKTLCPHCLNSKIEEFFSLSTWRYTKHDPMTECQDDADVWKRKCDFLEEEHFCVTGIRGYDYDGASYNSRLAKDLGLFVMIGGYYWNGHHASQEAIKTLLTETGHMKSNILSLREGKMFYFSGKKLIEKPQSVKDIL